MDERLFEAATPGNRALVGYARVSTRAQDAASQIHELDAIGCVRVFTDVASGARSDRPALDEALQFVVAGDTLCVARLDRLGRSLRHLLAVVEDLERRGVALRSLHEGIDTATAGGRLVLHIFGSIAEFERELISERTRAGLAVARSRGRRGGRKRKLSPRQVADARSLLAERDAEGRPVRTYAQVAESFGVGRATLYRTLANTPEEPLASRTAAR